MSKCTHTWQLSPAPIKPLFPLLPSPSSYSLTSPINHYISPTIPTPKTTQTHTHIPSPPTMPSLQKPLLFITLFTLLHSTTSSSNHDQTFSFSTNTKFNPRIPLSSSKRYEGSSNLVNLKYHMGPVLSSPINIYLIWYGNWPQSHKLLIKDFLSSISTTTTPSPSVSDWWHTVTLYTDQTGANISRTVTISGEYSDLTRSHGTHLTRLSIQQVIASAVRSAPFPVDHRRGIYLVLTASDITVEDFCRAVCGFHYFTFPSMVGYTLPYAWVGNSGKQCPEVCAYPFAVPAYMGGGGPGKLEPPNDDVGVDGMVSVIAHELAELSSNPLVNAWYAGEDPTAPTEIGDLCEGLYGSGGGGGYIGQVMKDKNGRTFNLNGNNGRRFLVQWIWSDVIKACAGPNAMD